ncbi:hypothetical protein SETIT_1G145500v2 [Setaria italica]|uniref:ATP-dependent DNA helicase n=1 Tax=Setaria italica TaxID=4555 RepID=A0A368PKC6_SETIT|nr:hypothetical protein SETIT_1G145500v2 [Setaria italica]
MTDEEKQHKLKKQCEAYNRRKDRDATQYQKICEKERQKYANMQPEQKKARIEQAITNRELRSSKTTKGSIAMENPPYMETDIRSDPKHLELYFYDDDPSLEHRYRRCREEKYEQDKHVVTILTQILRENPYSKQFITLGQNEKLDDYKLILNLDQRLDQRTYNAPITSEVAAVWIEGNERRNTFGKNIILHGNNNEIQGIKSYYGCYDPLSYPLFFPRAELGWHSNIPRANTILEELRKDNVDCNNNDNDPDSSSKLWVTMREYYCYRFHARPSIFNPILHGGRLFQQFAVDTYIKIESSRLDFIWYHQKEIKADLYKGLLDSIQEGEQKGDKNRASCKNNYPRPFNETTIQGKDSYPLYRRRNDGRNETVQNCKLDNRWVVPYNPYLLRFFNCHINVEVCSSIKAVKYLFKYIYKGHDRASVSVTGADDEGEIDEIRQLQNAREIIEESTIEVDQEDASLHTYLNKEQKAAYEKILAAVNIDSGGLFFVYGPGGTGKTFLYRALLATVRGQVVFGGDFRQVLPIVRKGTRAQIVDASLRRSGLWNCMQQLELVHNMRAQKDPWFAEYLLRIGNGTEETNENGEICLPTNICVQHTTNGNGLDTLIDNIYQMDNALLKDPTYITSRAILSTRNDCVDNINLKMIERFQGDEMVYYSFDSVEDDPHNYYPIEFLDTLTPNGVPPHMLKLKINCPIILLRNIDPANGLCNGTRLVVRGFQKNSIDTEIVLG